MADSYRFVEFDLHVVDREHVLRSVVTSHQLFDGFFRGPVRVLAELEHVAQPVANSHLELVEAKARDQRETGQQADRSQHLIGHGDGDVASRIAESDCPATITLVAGDADATTVQFWVRADRGVDTSILRVFETAIRVLITGAAPRETLTADVHDALREQLTLLESSQPSARLQEEPPLFVRRFHQLAERFPDRTAISFPDGEMTYRALAELTDGIAESLSRRGIGRSARILILADRAPSLVALVVAAFKIGSVVSIVDPQHPDSYLDECAAVLRPDLVVEVGNRGLSSSWPLARISDLIPERGSPPSAPRHVDVLGPDDCAIITFTSGTSGAPKAVAGRYSSLTYFFDWMDGQFGPFSGMVFGMCSSLGHDPLQRDIMTPLYLGGCVAIPDKSVFAGAERLCSWLEEAKVDVVCLNPALASMLHRAADSSSHLKLLFFVGAALSRDQAIGIRRAVPRARVVNLYGSTETQRAVAYYELPSDREEIQALPDIIPLGRGMKDVTVVVTDERRAERLPFQLGEIGIRSAHIALGYLGQPELTAAKFGSEPSAGGGALPVYWSGDLGYRSPEHGVVFLARADGQHKINGHRVELEQINASCRRHDRVRDAATVVVPVDGIATLVTYLVPDDPVVVISPVAFRSFLAEQLPAYMVPHRVETLSELPMTLNNKVDTAQLRALAVPEIDSELGDDGIVDAIRHHVRRHTAADDVPTDIPLQALGIDSLRLTVLSSSLASAPATGARRPAPAVHPGMTIADLASELQRGPSGAGPRPDVPSTSGCDRVEVPRPLDIFGPVTEVSETRIRHQGAEMHHLCSNSYLGLNSDARLRSEITQYFRSGEPISAHGSTELNGFTRWHQRLVDELCAIHRTETALLYSSGYLANLSVIPALAGPGDHVLIDSGSHRSIVDGCLLSQARLHVYRHNDADDLERYLQQSGSGKRLIVTEGCFSIEGDLLDLPAVSALARTYDCTLLVDEACSLGNVGPTGRGVAEHFGLPDAIDIRTGTLAKALVSGGGYVACDAKTAAQLRFQRGETFSTAISPLQAFVASAAAGTLRAEGAELIDRLNRNIHVWRTGLDAAGFDTGSSSTAIVPIQCTGPAEVDQRFQQALRAGIFCLPVANPWSSTTFALRTSVTAAHDSGQLAALATALGRHASGKPGTPTRELSGDAGQDAALRTR